MRFNRILSLAGSFGCCWAAAPTMSPQPPLYKIIRGEYEDKIRRYSPPEKIFDVFSERNDKGQSVLTLQGLLRAICFYNYSESTDEHLQGFDPESVKRLLGRNEDFQIYDYFLLVRFMAFDRPQLKAFMQECKLSELNKSSFKNLMLNFVCSDYDTYIKENIGLESRQFRPSKDEFFKAVTRSADSMFRDREVYSQEDFLNFKKALMKELYTYEFKCFKLDGDAIDGVEFARSIVKYAQNNQKRKLLRRVNAIEEGIQPIRITEKEYVDFHFELQTHLKQLGQALQDKGVITRQGILDLLKDRNDKITDGQVEVLYRLLDSDNSGFIEKREVLGVLESLGYYWNVKTGEQTLGQLVQTRWKNLQVKLRKIHEIVMEE